MDRQPILVGTLATLRPTTADDHAALHAVASDPAIRDQHPAHDRWHAADGRVIGATRQVPAGDDNHRSRRAIEALGATPLPPAMVERDGQQVPRALYELRRA